MCMQYLQGNSLARAFQGWAAWVDRMGEARNRAQELCSLVKAKTKVCTLLCFLDAMCHGCVIHVYQPYVAGRLLFG